MLTITANDAEELREIARAVHDLWFYREAITYEVDRRRVVIPLVCPVTKRLPFLRIPYDTPGEASAGTLTFDDVEDLQVVDLAETGGYNVNRVDAEPCHEGFRITLSGGIPIHIVLICSAIAVRFTSPGAADS